jgi:diaminopimelate decarboxylase
MQTKKLPFSKEELEAIASKYPTPFHIYDEKAMLENISKLLDAFAWNKGFKEYFAVKAAPNPYLLRIFKNAGLGADCSSLPELLLAESAGITGSEIMFTSNNTPDYEYQKAASMGATINLDDISHIEYLEKCAGLPELVSFRYNPGSLKTGNAIIGEPEEAKYGFTKEQLFEGFRILINKGVKRFGLHTMVASNELNVEYFADTAELMFSLAKELNDELGICFEFVNLGGGIGIPYKPEQKAIDLSELGAAVKAKYDKIIAPSKLGHVKIFLEAGRVITGPYGYLVTTVLHKKKTYKNYVGVDASMANLMRPGMYGSYHHITIPGKETEPCNNVCDVTGSLCENNDKFAIDRPLPNVEPGNLMVIHDAGAHGHAMGFNYNGKLRSAELLLRADKSVSIIRRAETIEDHFATLDFSGIENF